MVLIALMCQILALLGMFFHLLTAFDNFCRSIVPGLDRAEVLSWEPPSLNPGVQRNGYVGRFSLCLYLGDTKDA